MNKFIELEFQPTGGDTYSVKLQGGTEGKQPEVIIHKSVPAFDPEYYRKYQQACRQHEQTRLGLKSAQVKTAEDLAQIRQHVKDSATDLLHAFDRWGESPEFAEIDKAILHRRGYANDSALHKSANGDRSENLRVTISTECPHLRKLPFHKWQLFPDDVEVIFSGIQAQRPDRKRHPEKIRILAILGDKTNICKGVDRDKQEIQNYCGGDAEVVFLAQPTKDELTAILADEKGWDIIFFSGHSDTNDENIGKIYINATDGLEMAELKEVLQPAIAKRVQIAIFNSCDGLGLAPELEELNIDRLIVMREPIPDEVAQKFLKNFLRAFTGGKRFDDAVKVARQQLVEVEDEYPYASWLPIVIQNRLVTSLISPTWQSLGKIRSPYKGLAAFTEADADNFYGREEIVDRVAELVSQEPLVPIVGASGSGKSSLVQAGLIPKLRQDPNCKWQILTMRPGSKPFDALAQAIANCDCANLETIALDIELASKTDALTRKLAQIRTNEHRLLLFIDQFEELFTQVADPASCQKFLESLADAVRNAPNFTLVFTLRDDFSPKLQNNVHDDDFRPLLERYRPQPLVGMTRDRLKAAITEPVAKINVEFEGGLVDRLVQDVGNDAGNLPLLQMVLDLLWQQQQPRLLTNQAYDKICGEKGLKIVLANLAEKIYDGYVKQDKVKEFKQVLLRLVTLGDGNTPNTRRIATHVDIGEDNWQKIVVPLSTERLLKTNLDEKTQAETVEIIHETLIQSWQRLMGWIEDYRQELEQIAEIETAAIKWDRNKRSKHNLWKDKKLKEARKFSKDRNRFLPLKSIANDFLLASVRQQRWKRGQVLTLGMIVPGIFLGWAARSSLIAWNVAKINNFPKNHCESSQLSPAFELLKLIGHPLKEGTDLVDRNLRCINLSGANLSGANLSDAILSNAILSNANLRDANLRRAKLSGAKLNGAKLNGANLSNAILSNTNLSDANLSGAKLSNTKLNGADLRVADLSNTNLSDANLSSAKLSGAKLDSAKLSNTNLSSADLRGADLSNTKLSDAILNGAKLSGAKLDSAKLSGVDLSGVDLSEAKLTGADLGGADLGGADLGGADLSGADLSGAKLSGAKLSGAKLSGAKLIEAKLDSAKLIEADLSGADLIGAKLGSAKLNGAKLNGAKLSRADLSGADLSGADLSGANLSAILNGAKLSRADLSDADLNGADLGEGSELTKTLAQIKLAKNWEKAKYDPEIRKKLGLK
jgi:uncharacterized protein YjbI with pentapeptide repeats